MDALLCRMAVVGALFFLAQLSSPAQPPTPSSPPAAPKKPVADIYAGISVVDDYFKKKT
jgi:hypothetical protein